MVKDIVKDPIFLSRKCKTANAKEDEQWMTDLLDTALYYKETKNCVGLACNQIGGNKRLEWFHFLWVDEPGNCEEIKADSYV